MQIVVVVILVVGIPDSRFYWHMQGASEGGLTRTLQFSVPQKGGFPLVTSLPTESCGKFDNCVLCDFAHSKLASQRPAPA